MLKRSWEIQPNLLNHDRLDPTQEVMETLVEEGNVRLVRTSSTGQALGPYLQDEAEWVLVLEGEAVLRNGAGEEVHLVAGDGLYLPKGYEHWVVSTSDPCLWLCVYWSDEATNQALLDASFLPKAPSTILPGDLPRDLPLIRPLGADQERNFTEVVMSLRVVVHLPYAKSLKEKRKVKQRLVTRVSQEAGVSVKEVACQDVHSFLYLSVAGVALGQQEAEALGERVLDLLSRYMIDGAYVQAYDLEVL